MPSIAQLVMKLSLDHPDLRQPMPDGRTLKIDWFPSLPCLELAIFPTASNQIGYSAVIMLPDKSGRESLIHLGNFPTYFSILAGGTSIERALFFNTSSVDEPITKLSLQRLYNLMVNEICNVVYSPQVPTQTSAPESA